METLARAISHTIVERGIRPQSSYDRCYYGAHTFLSSALTTIVMLAVALVMGLVPEFLVYTAVYWTVHSVADAYHCNRYYRCLLMSTALFTGMGLFCLFTNVFTRQVFSWMLILITLGLLIFQMVEWETRPMFTRKRIAMYSVMTVAAIILLLTPYISVAFPFTYGICVITILQSKVRKQE